MSNVLRTELSLCALFGRRVTCTGSLSFILLSVYHTPKRLLERPFLLDRLEKIVNPRAVNKFGIHSQTRPQRYVGLFLSSFTRRYNLSTLVAGRKGVVTMAAYSSQAQLSHVPGPGLKNMCREPGNLGRFVHIYIHNRSVHLSLPQQV